MSKNNKYTETVFFVHFKSSKIEEHYLTRYNEAKTASDFFDWICEKHEYLKLKYRCDFTITNCKIIR